MTKTLPLPKARNLYLTKQVDQASMGELTKQILEINEDDRYLEKLYDLHGVIYKSQPIRIHIDSYGGAVYQCFGLIGVMESSETEVHTIVTGCAMSCGFMILIHGDKRFGYKHATPLYHQVSSGAHGTVKAIEEKVAHSKALQKIIEKMTLARTDITKKRLKKIYKTKTDWYMTAEEALSLGVIDEII